MLFLREIHRRSVFQIAAVYTVVGWLIIQMVDVVSEPLNLPDWFDTVVIVFVVAGLPIAMVLAWAFDVTSTGIERTEKIVPEEHSAALQVSAMNPHAEKSIVVMPFANMSRDLSDEYFSDGLTEELINSLGGVPGLQVAARTSSFACKGKNDDIKTIGEKLNVQHVLEGSVRHSGGQLRVTARLIDVSNGYNLWSEKFHKNFEDVFQIQEDIARSIVTALEIELQTAKRNPLVQRGTNDFAAYRNYLQGRYYWNRRTANGLKSSARYFNKAIEIDPNYANAYAGLADSFALCGIAEYGLANPKVVMPRAKTAALNALKINPKSVEAQTTLAHIQAFYDWDWSAAEQGFLKAVEIGPNYAFSHHWYAVYLSAMGRHDEAIEQAQLALELEPLSLIVNKNIGMTLYYAQRFGDACIAYREALDLDSTFARTLFYSAMVFDCEGNDDDAISDIRKALLSDPTNGVYSAFLAYTCARSNRQNQAIEIREKLIKKSEDTYVPALNIAIIDLGLKEYTSAFQWLERAVQERSSWLVSLKVDPIFAEIRNQPEFRSLTKKIGLP